MSTIGIDFGTSFCSASWFNKNLNHPEVVTFPETASQKMPSIIYVSPDGDLVGRMAAEQLEAIGSLDPSEAEKIMRNTVTSIKRKMRKDGKYAGLSAQTVISRIFSKILTEMKVSCQFGNDIPDSVVLTHPVKFTQWMKDILEGAAKEAGLRNVVFLEEPVSAALGVLRHNHLQSKGLMVYDLGAGTFDVAYVEVKDGERYNDPLESLGDAKCGGDDIDRALYDFIEKEAKRIKGRPIYDDPLKMHYGFLNQCRSRKESLSVRFATSPVNELKVTMMLPMLKSGGAATALTCTITRVDFCNIINPTVDKTIAICKTMVSAIKTAGKPLDHVLLIGGGSKLPTLRDKLRSIVGSGVTVISSGEAETAVALGACYYSLPGKGISKSASVADVVKSVSDSKTAAWSSKAKYCIWCGKPLASYYKFCIYCGNKIVD